MAHNSKRNRRDTTAHDDEDFVYPTKKVRETKTRNRRSDKDLIRDGLITHANRDALEVENDWHDGAGMGQDSEEQKNMDEYNQDQANMDAHYDDIDEAARIDRLHEDLREDTGYDWENY